MTVSSGSLLRAMRGPSRSENSRSHAVQRSRSMCLCVPVHDRCAMLPPPGRLNCAQGGFGHENRVSLSWTGVVSVIGVLLCAGLDQKILIRRPFFHVTILQDYRTPILCKWTHMLCKQLTNILAGPHWLPSISPDRFSRLPSGSRSPRGAHRAADRQPAAADGTLLYVRGAVDRAETPALPADGYPVTPTTL